MNAGLARKSAICFGDSITWYDGHPYNWGKEVGKIAIGFPSYLRSAGMSVQNEGISDATIREIWEHIKHTSVTGFDYVFITSGANDSRYGVPTDDFCDCLRGIIEYIRIQNERACVVLMTPLRGWIYAPLGYAYDRQLDGEVEERFADAIASAALRYGCALCDWYHDSGIRLENRATMMNDPEPDTSAPINPNPLYSLHPSTMGYRKMAKLLLQCLESC